MADPAAVTRLQPPCGPVLVADVRREGPAHPLTGQPLDDPWEREMDPEPLCPRIFHHHLYEYGRGVRALFLMTITAHEAGAVAARLSGQGIAHFVQQVAANKVNVFFGRTAFVEAAKAFVTKPLNTLTPEEDFMLGTLLGYDREQQCVRFLERKARLSDPPMAIAAE